MKYKAVIAGASGLVGGKLIKLLLQSGAYQEVVALVRKELPVQHPKLLQAVIKFDELQNHANLINGHALFCCLGTTRKQTPDLLQYHKIDHDYPVQLATLAAQNKVVHFHLVSAIGANSKSYFFYTKTKGETENDIRKLNLRTVHIYQPSMLTGNRKDFRLSEKIATGVFKFLDPLLVGSLKKYQSVPAETVARAMYNQSLNTEEGVFIHPSDHLNNLA